MIAACFQAMRCRSVFAATVFYALFQICLIVGLFRFYWAYGEHELFLWISVLAGLLSHLFAWWMKKDITPSDTAVLSAHGDCRESRWLGKGEARGSLFTVTVLLVASYLFLQVSQQDYYYYYSSFEPPIKHTHLFTGIFLLVLGVLVRIVRQGWVVVIGLVPLVFLVLWQFFGISGSSALLTPAALLLGFSSPLPWIAVTFPAFSYRLRCLEGWVLIGIVVCFVLTTTFFVGEAIIKRRANPQTFTTQVVPVHFIEQLVVAEDFLFFVHQGIDFSRMKQVLRGMHSFKLPSRGGSTLSMQLVKMRSLSYEKSLLRKWRQIVLARVLELRSSKAEILQEYLQRVDFGNGQIGTEAAAQYYFNKKARFLTPHESLYLVLAIENPYAFNPSVPMRKETSKRYRWVQRRWKKVRELFWPFIASLQCAV